MGVWTGKPSLLPKALTPKCIRLLDPSLPGSLLARLTCQQLLDVSIEGESLYHCFKITQVNSL